MGRKEGNWSDLAVGVGRAVLPRSGVGLGRSRHFLDEQGFQSMKGALRAGGQHEQKPFGLEQE